MHVKVDVTRRGDDEGYRGVNELHEDEHKFGFYAVRGVLFVWTKETDFAELFQRPRVLSIFRVHGNPTQRGDEFRIISEFLCVHDFRFNEIRYLPDDV